jgi:hypothetical protein
MIIYQSKENTMAFAHLTKIDGTVYGVGAAQVVSYWGQPDGTTAVNLSPGEGHVINVKESFDQVAKALKDAWWHLV